VYVNVSAMLFCVYIYKFSFCGATGCINGIPSLDTFNSDIIGVSSVAFRRTYFPFSMVLILKENTIQPARHIYF
jgi:hypothetical protein